jgi:hypothetical protein
MEMRKEKGREGDGDEARQNGTGARESGLIWSNIENKGDAD